MIVNGLCYAREIRDKFREIWYEPKYKWYFSGQYRFDVNISSCDGSTDRRHFASVNEDGELLGYITFEYTHDTKVVDGFGAINFSDNKVVFGRDLLEVLKIAFIDLNAQVMEWGVVCGNPIESSYDKACLKMGGRILCQRTGRATDSYGNICDDKLYEVPRDGFIKFLKKYGQYYEKVTI